MALYSGFHITPYKPHHAMSREIESSRFEPPEFDGVKHDITSDQGCLYFNPSFIMRLSKIAQYIFGNRPQTDDPGMLNTALRSDEGNDSNIMKYIKFRGHQLMRFGNQHDCQGVVPTKSRDQEEPGCESSPLLKNREGRQPCPDYTNLNVEPNVIWERTHNTTHVKAINQETELSTAKRRQRRAGRMKRATTPTQPRLLEQFPEVPRQRRQTPKQQDPLDRRVSDESSSTGPDECFCDSGCALESYDTAVSTPPHNTVSKRRTHLFKKIPPPNVEKRTSALSLALSQERQQKQQRTGAPRGRSEARVIAGRNMMKALDTRRAREKAHDDEVQRREGSRAEAEENKMLKLLRIADRTRIKIYKDPRIDSAAESRRFIDWLDDHDLDHIFFPK